MHGGISDARIVVVQAQTGVEIGTTEVQVRGNHFITPLRKVHGQIGGDHAFPNTSLATGNGYDRH